MKTIRSSKKGSGGTSPLIALATLWMSGVAADAGGSAANAMPWGTSHATALAGLRRHSYEDPINDVLMVKNSYSVPLYPNSLLRQQESSKNAQQYEYNFDVSESKDNLELTMKVPGSSARDISIELEDDKVLHIRGYRYQHDKKKHGGYTSETKFDKTYEFKDSNKNELDLDKLHVHLSKGILTVTVPKKPKQRKQFPILSHDDPPGIL